MDAINKAIVAASEKDYVKFQEEIGPELEDRLKTSIAARSAEIESSLFGGAAAVEDDDEDDEYEA